MSFAGKTAVEIQSFLLGPQGTPVKLVISKDTSVAVAKEDAMLCSSGPRETVEILRGTETDPAGVGLAYEQEAPGTPWLITELAQVRLRGAGDALGSGYRTLGCRVRHRRM